jgi:hypothetical protein
MCCPSLSCSAPKLGDGLGLREHIVEEGMECLEPLVPRHGEQNVELRLVQVREF